MGHKLISVTTFPTWYQVAFYRELAQRLGTDFQAIFAHGGHADGISDPTWGDSIALNQTGLLEGYDNVVLNRRPGQTLAEAVRLPVPEVADHLRSLHPDAVLLNDHGRTPACKVAIRAARGLGARLLLRSTPYDVRPSSLQRELARTSYLRFRYRVFDKFCAVGTLPRIHFERYGGDPGRVVSSPYCADEFFLKPLAAEPQRSERRELFRERHGIASAERVLLTVSRLIPLKRIGWTLRAFERSRKLREAHLVIVGDGPDRGIVERATGSSVSTSITWLGAQDRAGVADALAAADMFVLPSEFEPWGVVVNEALLFRLPVVLSDRVASSVDLVQPGVTGYTFRWDDENEYVERILQVHDLLDRGLDHAAFERLNERFSAPAAARGILRAAEMLDTHVH